ncbi:MAG: hypothetical protein QM647_03105 [Asticcacaulis sp.]|uniref:hypothetical protein n=1 Tax=Asticcacaulis sp. TaxID=1872648 RepID=UPI0039E3887B
MVSLFLQGFALLFVAFVIGLPLGHLLAKQVRRWVTPRRVETARILDTAAVDLTARPDPDDNQGIGQGIGQGIDSPSVLPWSESVTYPVSAFGRTTVSVRPDRP